MPTVEPIDGRIELLERLGRRREQGILTDEEFTVQKRRILES